MRYVLLVFLLAVSHVHAGDEFEDVEEEVGSVSNNPLISKTPPVASGTSVAPSGGQTEPNAGATLNDKSDEPAADVSGVTTQSKPKNSPAQPAGKEVGHGPSDIATDLSHNAPTRAPSEQEQHASAAALDQHQASALNKAKSLASDFYKSLLGTPEAPPPPGSVVAANPLMNVGAVRPPPLPRETPGQAQAPAPLPAGASRPSPLLKTAEGQVRIGDFRAADQTTSRRLAEAPDDRSAYRWRAFARRGLRQFDDSSSDAHRALEFMPTDGEVRGILIRNLVDLGRSQEALAEADKALKERGPDAHVLAARADAKASMGDLAGGLVDLAKAAMLNKEFEEKFQRAQRAVAPTPSTAPRTGVARMITWLIGLMILAVYVWTNSRNKGSMTNAMRATDQLAATLAPAFLPRGYDFLGTIAVGGMGAVNKARDRALNRIVAIKRMHPELKNNPRELARFIKEARLVAELKHPNIVEIFAIEEDSEGVFLVFEHLEGRTLHERIVAGKLERGEALFVLKQTALAVEHAHAQRIIHRDLKPANIMVTAHGVKVMDFGIARSTLDPLSTMSRVEVAGTPVYMAPEQEYSGVVGPAADVYALAGCAYEMLSGRPPFTYGGMMKAQRHYIPLSQAAKLPAAVDVVMDRALDPEPSGRWQGAREFYAAMEAALA